MEPEGMFKTPAAKSEFVTRKEIPNGGFYTLDESSEIRTGTFDQQNSVTIENPGSNYVVGSNGAVSTGTDFLGLLVPTGTTTSGTLPGVVDVISNAGLFPARRPVGATRPSARAAAVLERPTLPTALLRSAR